MKNIWQIITVLMGVALVALTLRTTLNDNKLEKMNSIHKGQDSLTLNSESALDVIMSRSSVRTYTDQKVEPEKIEIILRAAMAAPTAGNRQPWEFVVIDDRAVLDSIPLGIVNKAQLAIAVCGVPSKSFAPPLDEYWVQDCSAATENLLLAAHAIGLGAVWCGAYPNTENNRVAKYQELLSLPEDVYVLSVVAIGYPDSEPYVKDKWDEAKVHYNQY